ADQSNRQRRIGVTNQPDLDSFNGRNELYRPALAKRHVELDPGRYDHSHQLQRYRLERRDNLLLRGPGHQYVRQLRAFERSLGDHDARSSHKSHGYSRISLPDHRELERLVRGKWRYRAALAERHLELDPADYHDGD